MPSTSMTDLFFVSVACSSYADIPSLPMKKGPLAVPRTSNSDNGTVLIIPM